MITKVLLIEDDEDDFFLLQENLRAFAHLFELTWAKDFAEGIDLLRLRPGLCLIDYHLGEYNGLEFIRQALVNGYRGPLILLTGMASEGIDEMALVTGADDYISKAELNEHNLKRTLLFNIERKKTENRLIESEEKLRNMNEISSSTLHNIGNVLNNLTVSSQTIERLIEQIDLGKLDLVAKLLEEKEQLLEDDRGKLVPPYLRQLQATLEGGIETIKTIASESSRRLEIARGAIAGQQKIASGSSKERIQLLSLLEEAFNLHRERFLQMGIVTEIKVGSETVRFNQATLSHVLINLTKNAIEALSRCAVKEIRAKTRFVEGDLVLCLEDTGIGMDEDTVSRLFTHGFTTKQQGNGLGLHFCQQALAKEGCTILAKSPGPGKGAMFEIFFPEELVVQDPVAG